jgi:hypothetical protein
VLAAGAPDRTDDWDTALDAALSGQAAAV